MAKLVVEDSTYMRNIVCAIATEAGHEVVSAAVDGIEGRSAVLEHDPDCLLTDLLMPNCGGVEMIESLRDDAVNRLDPEQYDALLEIFTIGIGRAATTLNDVVDSHVGIELARLRLCRAADLANELPSLAGKKLGTVSMGFDGPFRGSSGLIIPEQDALDLVATLVGEKADATMLDEMRVGALIEVGNIVLNGILGSIANAMEGHLEYSVPEFVEGTLANLFFEADASVETEVLIAGATVQVERLRIHTEIVLVLEMSTIEQLAQALSMGPAAA